MNLEEKKGVKQVREEKEVCVILEREREEGDLERE